MGGGPPAFGLCVPDPMIDRGHPRSRSASGRKASGLGVCCKGGPRKGDCCILGCPLYASFSTAVGAAARGWTAHRLPAADDRPPAIGQGEATLSGSDMTRP